MEVVEIPLPDASSLYAVVHTAVADKPLILMFHQAGSNVHGEYVSIWPRLQAEGFGYVAVDLRTGGQLYGDYNRSVAPRTSLISLCDAYEDVESAFLYVKTRWPESSIVAWGSSFSAAHVISLASKFPDDIEKVVAFSPSSGGPMKDCKADAFLENLSIPLLLIRPESELEIPSVQEQFQLAVDSKHETFIARPGYHGASNLDGSRVQGPVEETWQVLLDFLDKDL
jgi:pimeloyl-ACP methyl ester carboxylesterase